MSPIYVPGKVTLAKESVAADPYYNNVSLLLHGDGANGSTTIVDSSQSPKTVTAIGNAQLSTAQSKFGGSSIAFDGSGDYLQTASAEFSFGITDFTLELWFYINSVQSPNNRLMFFADNKSNIDITAAGKILFYDGSMRNTSGNALPINQWHHVAVTRNLTNLKIFVNGENLGSFTSTVDYGVTSRQLFIGANNLGTESFNGYIDDFRITKGVARYTSNFTPPTAPFPEVLG